MTILGFMYQNVLDNVPEYQNKFTADNDLMPRCQGCPSLGSVLLHVVPPACNAVHHSTACQRQGNAQTWFMPLLTFTLSDRAEQAGAVASAATSAAERHADQLAAEHRVMAESTRAMRQECHSAWVRLLAASSLRCNGLCACL